MNWRPNLSRGRAVALVASVLAFAVARLAIPRQLPGSVFRNEIAALTSERERLRGNDDTVRDGLRAKVKAAPGFGWTGERLQGWIVPPGWHCDWQPPSSLAQDAILNASALRLADWPSHFEFIRHCTAEPGVTLVALEVKATGTGRARRFTQLSLHLRFTLASTAGNHAARPHSGSLPATSAKPTAMIPKVGRPFA